MEPTELSARLDRIYKALTAELHESDQRTGMYLRSGDVGEAHACASYGRGLIHARDWIRHDSFPNDPVEEKEAVGGNG